MIDNTFVKAEGPLYADREEALEAPGAIYHHIKGGGIYRRMGSGKYAGDKCAAELEGEYLSVYEHLWPHAHEFYIRPDSEFEEIVTSQYGEHPRFSEI